PGSGRSRTCTAVKASRHGREPAHSVKRTRTLSAAKPWFYLIAKWVRLRGPCRHRVLDPPAARGYVRSHHQLGGGASRGATPLGPVCEYFCWPPHCLRSV